MPLEVASKSKEVFAEAVKGAEGLVKLAVYNATPFVHRKLVMYPLNAAPKLGVVSFPIRNAFVVSLKFVEFVSVVPICVPFLNTRKFVPDLQIAK